jgi:hypothetical protein
LQRLLLRFRQELDLTPASCRGFFRRFAAAVCYDFRQNPSCAWRASSSRVDPIMRQAVSWLSNLLRQGTLGLENYRAWLLLPSLSLTQYSALALSGIMASVRSSPPCAVASGTMLK